MRAGQLNCRVTLQQLAAGQDVIGQPVQTWSDVTSVWANIRYASGTESIKAGADMSVVRASVQMRYLAGVTPGMRVTHGAEVYEIKAVLPDVSGREYLNLACEVVNAVT